MSYADNNASLPEIQANALLAELRQYAQWVLWRMVDGRKVPYQPSDIKADVSDSATWSTYEAASAALANGGFNGLGFVLSGNDPFTCVDVDDKEGIGLSLFQQTVLNGANGNTYIETSPSGRGYHIWARGKVETRKANRIEVYSQARYITVTFAPVDGCNLAPADAQDDLTVLVNNLRPQIAAPTGTLAQDCQETRTRADIINAISLSQHRDWFSSLWSGDWTTKPSASEADWQLCCLLMEHGATNAQVESIFLESGLGQRDTPKEMIRKIRTTIKNARAQGKGMSQQQTNPPQPKTNPTGEITIQPVPFSKRGLVTKTMSNTEPVITEWLWYRHLPKKRLALLAGIGSAGKSTLTLKMAATVSSGGVWPDGTQCQPGAVLLWSGEDLWDEDVVPRLAAMGANPDNVINIEGALDEHGRKIPFNAVRDVPLITETLKKHPGVSLVIISPLVSMVKGDMNATNITRDGLQALVDMAQQTGVCVLGISHFRKDSEGQNPVDRVLGSAAFTQLPRVVMGAARSPDGTRRALAVIKGNNGRETLGAIEYSIEGKEITFNGVTVSADNCSEIVWGNKIDGVAHEIFDDIEGVEVKGNVQKTKQSQFDTAIELLKIKLADGAKVPTKELDDYMLKTIGIKKAVYKDVKTHLKVQALPDGYKGEWKYSLPDTTVLLDIPVPQQWAQRPN